MSVNSREFRIVCCKGLACIYYFSLVATMSCGTLSLAWGIADFVRGVMILDDPIMLTLPAAWAFRFLAWGLVPIGYAIGHDL